MVNVHIHQFAGSAPVDAHAMEQFQKQWTSYQKLVDNDYLSHREIGERLGAALIGSFARPFALLDIACGDASLMKRVLPGTKAMHYHGIDLAEPALELAAKNLAGMPFAIDLDQRDFVAALDDRLPEPTDVSWCSLSIHHLETPGKLELLKAIRRATKSFVMIYEPTLRDGEDRPAFLDRFAKVNRALWKSFDGRGMGTDRTSCEDVPIFPRRARAGSISATKRALPGRARSSPIRPISTACIATTFETGICRMKFANDDELFTAMRQKLFTAVVGDVLDTLGLSASVPAAQYPAVAR